LSIDRGKVKRERERERKKKKALAALSLSLSLRFPFPFLSHLFSIASSSGNSFPCFAMGWIEFRSRTKRRRRGRWVFSFLRFGSLAAMAALKVSSPSSRPTWAPQLETSTFPRLHPSIFKAHIESIPSPEKNRAERGEDAKRWDEKGKNGVVARNSLARPPGSRVKTQALACDALFSPYLPRFPARLARSEGLKR
jgi:hypothetical protein